jgi:hypothetical protein
MRPRDPPRHACFVAIPKYIPLAPTADGCWPNQTAGHIRATYVHGHTIINVARDHNTKVGCSKRPEVMVNYPCQPGLVCLLLIILINGHHGLLIFVGVTGLQHQAAQPKTIPLFLVHWLDIIFPCTIAQVHVDFQICLLLCLSLIPVHWLLSIITPIQRGYNT